METWKPIPNFNGYEVSDHGRVRSYQKRGGGDGIAWSIADTPQRILKGGTKVSGYPFVLLCQNGVRKNYPIHQLVMLAFVGPCPESLEVCHNDLSRDNNYLKNLRYDTHSANMKERIWRKRRTPKEIVLALRHARANGTKIIKLSKTYGYSTARISQICTGKSYPGDGGPLTRTKLTKEQARTVRQLRISGMLLKDIGKKFGVTVSAISIICSGKRHREHTT